jgi:isopentenyl diphosphate isomerase/L-lactate dehydrogenase-like FMN-dependent dehydrogenase
MDMVTLRENVSPLDRYCTRPRITVNVGDGDLSAEIYGQKVRFFFYLPLLPLCSTSAPMVASPVRPKVT